MRKSGQVRQKDETQLMQSQAPLDMEPPLVFARPRPRRGCAFWLLVLILIVAAGGTVSWQFLDEKERDDLGQQLSELVESSPLDFLRDRVMPHLETRPPVPPINQSGDSGVIVLPDSRGAVVSVPITPQAAEETQKNDSAADADPDKEAEDMDKTAEPAPAAQPLPEDEYVRKSFIDDLAAWVVSRYEPGRQRGSLAVSVQSLNQRYAVSMTGLQAPSRDNARASLLRYAYTPSMVRGLYEVYADSFLRALARQSEGRGKLSGEQLAGLYRTVGSRCLLLASGLEAVASLPDLSGRLRVLDQKTKEVTDANRKLLDASFELARLRDHKGTTYDIGEAQYVVDMALRNLRRVMEAEDSASRRLVRDIRAANASALSDTTLIYLARWVGRRLNENPQAQEATRVAAHMLRDLALRCDKAAREGAPADPAAAAAQARVQESPR